MYFPCLPQMFLSPSGTLCHRPTGAVAASLGVNSVTVMFSSLLPGRLSKGFWVETKAPGRLEQPTFGPFAFFSGLEEGNDL